MTEETSAVQLERCLQKAKDNPDSAPAHFNLGLMYTQRARMSSAEKSYRRALEIDPELIEAWINLGGVLLLKWDFEAAKKANQQALQLDSGLVLAHYNMGQASLYMGDAAGVESANRKVIELDPEHAAGHYFLAVGLLALERVEEARSALALAMQLGHRPTPEFLRGLENVEKNKETNNVNPVTNIGADAPQDSKEN
jgi:tetratricopeptide (TPR) repeat protein